MSAKKNGIGRLVDRPRHRRPVVLAIGEHERLKALDTARKTAIDGGKGMSRDEMGGG